MTYESFDIDDSAGSLELLNTIVATIEDVDIIKDGLTELLITSRFNNIFYYSIVSEDLLIKNESHLLNSRVSSDHWVVVRMLDFLKDNNGYIRSNYLTHYKAFLKDVVSLLQAHVHSKEYEEFSDKRFASKIFKQYIINLVYICIDIYNAVR